MMNKFLPLALLVGGAFLLSAPLAAQDFMLQGWYWDYDKDGCNGYSGPNWATTLSADAAAIEQAGFTYVWLPPASRASFGACSNGYDPQDLYDLGEYGGGRTGLGTRAEVNTLISDLSARGIGSVADVVYNHRDGGQPEDNPAVKAYIETHFNGGGQQPYPSDRYRVRLPLGGTYGAGEYYFKISSRTQGYGANQYKFYATAAGVANAYAGSVNESEPNGGGDCGQPHNTVLLDQDIVATLHDWMGCYTDEFRLVIGAGDYNAAGDDLLIYLTNVSGGYSDHRIYGVYYQPADGSPGFSVDLADLKYQTYTDFTGLPSGQGGMGFENFRPNSANAATTFMAGDFDSPLFFYDVVQEEATTLATYADWSEWLLNDVGFGGLRMDAVKHFPPAFVAQLLDELAARGQDPGMVVGEFFDTNPTKLKDWVDDVNAAVTSSTSLVRVFDFSLRSALKEASDNGGYDCRNVFNASLFDNGLSGFNVVTFINNHDYRGPGEAVQTNPLLAYAYLLTNNQLGVPSVFYPDLFGKAIPHAPTVDLEADIAELIGLHRDYIAGSPAVDYLNRFGTPYAASYSSGGPGDGLIYQMSGGGAGGDNDVVVAVNFGYQTLKVDHGINVAANRAGSAAVYTDLSGNAFNPTATLGPDGRLLIDVPARSYAVYVRTAALPAELVSFTAVADGKGAVELGWATATEEALSHFTVEAGPSPTELVPLARHEPRGPGFAYRLTDDRPWTTAVRYYRLRTVSAGGEVQLSPVRQVAFQPRRLAVRPNPARDWVEVSGLPAGVPLTVTAPDGRRVSVPHRGGDGRVRNLDVSGLRPGVYSLHAGNRTARLVVR